MSSKFLNSVLAVFIMSASFIINFANASLISFEVKGSADIVNPVLSPYFDLGDNMSLVFNMDLDTIGFENEWFSANRQLSPMSFSVGTYAGTVSSYQPSITNGPNCPYVCGDVWSAEAKNDFGTTFNFPMFGDYYLDIIQIEYYDPSGIALSTINMAESIGQLSNFSNWHLSLYFKDINNPDGARFSVNSFTPNVTYKDIPEPTSIVIFTLGMMVLVSSRFKKNS